MAVSPGSPYLPVTYAGIPTTFAHEQFGAQLYKAPTAAAVSERDIVPRKRAL